MVIWLDLDIIKIKPPKTGLKNADISKNPNIQLSVNFGMDSHRSMDNHTRGGGGYSAYERGGDACRLA